MVVAPSVRADVEKMVVDAGGQVRRRRYRKGDLAGHRLCVVAVGDDILNNRIRNDAVESRVPINVVDNPEYCDFIFPAIVDRGSVVVGISSSGHSPVLVRWLRTKIEALLPQRVGDLASLCGRFRDRVKALLPEERRRLFWERVIEGPAASRMYAGDAASAARVLESSLNAEAACVSVMGEAYLIGAGPGDPDLMTVKAVRLLQQADVIVYDRLVSPEAVDLARRDAERVFVGKRAGRTPITQDEISAMLVRYVREGHRVARLKGGDPFVFGRGGEEALALAEACLPFQIVPGVSAANGCAAYAGIPLTHRNVARNIRFTTLYKEDVGDVEYWRRLVKERDTTMVFYMSGGLLEQLAACLIGNGCSPDTPVAVVSRGTTPSQKVVSGTLASIAAQDSSVMVSPLLVMVGDVVALREQLGWFEDYRDVLEFPQIA